MARRWWPDGRALGRSIRIDGTAGRSFEVIGVARDARFASLVDAPEPFAYFSLYQRYYSASTLHVQPAARVRGLLDPVRAEIVAAARGLSVSPGRLLRDHVADAVAPQTTALTLLGLSGVLALGLSTVGIHAVVVIDVRRRTREIGIRIALGASPWSVIRAVVAESLWTVLAGIVLGGLVAIWAARFSAALLFGVGWFDPMSYTVPGMLVLVATCLAAFVPARSAARVDPARALGGE
jgi:ABC-type antimicrobial peptide transport system permease subunit